MLEGRRLSISGNRELQNYPIKILKLFHIAQFNNIDIHPRALRYVQKNISIVGRQLRESPEANRLFIEMLTGPYPDKILKRLNESGVFGRFIPDFGRVVAQMHGVCDNKGRRLRT